MEVLQTLIQRTVITWPKLFLLSWLELMYSLSLGMFAETNRKLLSLSSGCLDDGSETNNRLIKKLGRALKLKMSTHGALKCSRGFLKTLEGYVRVSKCAHAKGYVNAQTWEGPQLSTLVNWGFIKSEMNAVNCLAECGRCVTRWCTHSPLAKAGGLLVQGT